MSWGWKQILKNEKRKPPMRLTSAELHPTLARTETCGLKQAGVHFNINAYMCMCETQ